MAPRQTPSGLPTPATPAEAAPPPPRVHAAPGALARRLGGARSRIALGFSLLAALLFGAICLLSAQQARRESERQTMAALQQWADRLAQQLDADMAARQREVAQLVATPQALGTPLTAAQWRSFLDGLKGTLAHYSWIGVATADGRVLAATGGLLEGADVRQRPWFREGLLRPVVHDVHEAVLLAKLLPRAADAEPPRFVDVAAPMAAPVAAGVTAGVSAAAPGGRAGGVLGAHLSWAWAAERRQQALALLPPQQGVEIVLVDRRGHVQLGPAQPRLGLAEGWQGVARTLRWTDGRDYLSAGSPSRAAGPYPGMGWTVVVRQPTATAFAAADALERRLLAAGVAGVLAFGLLGWWLAGRLTAPLREVAEQARAMGHEAGLPAMGSTALPGIGGAALPVASEVDELADALGRLLAQLRLREQSLAALNTELEQRVQDRTAQLQQANEDLRAFSRSLSHDIRGPLGSMAMLLGNLLRSEGPEMPERTHRVVGVVAQECERLRSMADALLGLSMVEQSTLRPAQVDTARLVDQALQEVRAAQAAQAAQADHPATVVVVSPLPAVEGDAALLRQAWVNLLGNALKFSAKAEQPRVEVSAVASEAEVVFTVADNGVGFDPSQADRLFGVFERLHSRQAFAGSGVGLSIVRRVAHRHGGRVWAESVAGGGARFHLALPRRFSPPEAERPLQPAEVDAAAA